MRVLSAEAMRAVDRAAIEELGLPGLVLMENAALGVVDAIGEAFPAARSVAVFCGPGNNGGDGLATARQLDARGYDVRVAVVTEGRGLSGDAGVQLEVVRKLGLPLVEPGAGDALDAALELARGCELVVDALFGTGLGRPLSGRWAELVDALNALSVPRVAVDIPSGLSGSRPEVPGPHVLADLTVTFAAPKLAHVFPPAADACGALVIADLGIPRRLVDEAEEAPEVGGPLHLLVAEELAAELPPRRADTHKGDYGHALILAGSPGKAGAAILAARAAVVAGAGLVTVAVPEPILAAVDLGSLESMTLGLPAGPAGQLTMSAAERALAAAEGKAVLAMGPGLGQEPEAAEAIRTIAREARLPLLLDADGVNAFAGRPRDLAARPAPTVLTPHPGELARLLGVTTAEVQADRPAAARRAAAETNAIVLLKGHLSLVATPTLDAALWINPTGNPGMASGGSGDVLTGLAAGLLAQRADDPLTALLLAVYLHGLAGDLAAERLGGPAVPAGELLASLPAAFARLASA